MSDIRNIIPAFPSGMIVDIMFSQHPVVLIQCSGYFRLDLVLLISFQMLGLLLMTRNDCIFKNETIAVIYMFFRWKSDVCFYRTVVCIETDWIYKLTKGISQRCDL